jgi:hypothetical protein
VRWWSQPLNFEVTGRFGLQRFTRLAEMRRTVDGDMGVLKLSRALVQGPCARMRSAVKHHDP